MVDVEVGVSQYMALGTTWFSVTRGSVWWMLRTVSPSTWLSPLLSARVSIGHHCLSKETDKGL